MQEKIIHYWCDRCGAGYVPPQEDPKVVLAILRDDKPTAQEFLGIDLCPACEKEFNELVEKFTSTTGNKTTSTEEKNIQSTSIDEVEPMGWEDWLENIKPIPNFTPPSVIELTAPSVPNWIPKCCRGCSNHPMNGGSGFCNCTLPYLENSTTGSMSTNTIATTTIAPIKNYMMYGDTSNDNQK